MEYIPYGRQYIAPEDIRAVSGVLDSDWLTQGPKIKEFEDRVCKYTGAKYAVAVSSGTAALHLACLASGLKKGDEAITTPMTFVATANAVLYAGAKPVFIDIKNGSFNIDVEKIESGITGKTKIILPVHFAGFPCDMARLSMIAKKSKIIVIEDACHALGAEYKYRDIWMKVGQCRHSDMAVFSFHPVKHITTGEGGMITTNNKNLYEKLKAFRTHGIYRDPSLNKKNGAWYYEMRDLGFNYRITDFQCALGVSQLKKIDLFIAKRRLIAQEYNAYFNDNSYFDLPQENRLLNPSWHLYPIRLKDRYINRKILLVDKLRSRGVGVQVHYIPVYFHPFYQKLGYKRGSCVNAENIYQRELSLPLFPRMNKKDVRYVVKTVINSFKDIDRRN